MGPGADRPDELGQDEQRAPHRSGDAIASSVRSRTCRSITARPRRPTGAGCTSAARPSRRCTSWTAKTLQTTKKIPLTGRPNNISIGQRRPPRLRRHRVGAGRRGRHRHRIARAREVDPDQGRHPQRVRHARRPARRRRLDCRPADDGDRRQDRGAGVDALQRGRAADRVREEPRRIDQADVRADLRPPRLRDRGLRGAEGSGRA